MIKPKTMRVNVGEPMHEYAARRMQELAEQRPQLAQGFFFGGAARDSNNAPLFIASLQATIVPEVCTGSPTFTRATAATVVDFEGIVRNGLSGEARFQGARRVQNFALATENPSSSSWTLQSLGIGSTPTLTPNFGLAPDGTQTAHRLQCALNGGNSSNAHESFLGNAGSPTYTIGRQSVYLRTNDGSSSATLTLRVPNYNATVHTVTIDSTWRRYSTLDTIAGSGTNSFVIGLRGDPTQKCSDSIDVLFWHPQLENVTGQANQNPSEYVSVGVLSAPFHGANVDGVQYFATQNGNVWNSTSKAVQELPGAAITPDGYLAEASAQNIVLQSQNYGSGWTLTDLTILSSTNIAPDESATAFLLQAGSAGTDALLQSFATPANSSYAISAHFKVSTTPWVFMRLGDGTNQIRGWWNISTGTVGSAANNGTASSAAVSIQSLANGWYRCTLTGAPNFTTASAGWTTFCVDGDASLTRVNSAARFQWGSQIESNGSVNAFATSYISTGAAAVTRNADVLSFTTAGNVSNLQGTAYAELQTLWALSPTASPFAITVNNANGIPMVVSGPSVAATQMRIFDGTLVVSRGGLTDMSTAVRKRGSSWGPAGQVVTGDGASVSTGAFDGTMGPQDNPLFIGCNTGGGNTWNGTIRNVTIWPYQFSNAQLQQQTT